MPDGLDLATNIKMSPHIRFHLKPVQYEKFRVNNRRELLGMIESCTVALRGWDFPHFDRENKITGDDSYASWNESFSVREFWKIWQSLQFVHLYDIREVAEKHPLSGPSKLESGIKGHLGLTNSIWNIAERLEFTYRLLSKINHAYKWKIVIEHNNIQDFVLTSEPSRPINHVYSCRSKSVSWEREFDSAHLITGYREIATDCSVDLFDRFGFDNLPRERVIALQDELYSLK